MGSPLVPVLPNIFIGFYESKWLNEYNFDKPEFYLRYVDDILAASDKEQDKSIKRYLNYKSSSNQNQLRDTSDVHYFKLSYIGNLSHHIKK